MPIKIGRGSTESFEYMKVLCPRCDGKGTVKGLFGKRRCGKCKGSGQISSARAGQAQPPPNYDRSF